ncbi:MAG: tRNA pseudouridine(55) synthase TruB [Synergistaceae bacterium]|nr:tRNA pseudouridine(55) synthase TruB [Synergistaceae bacterium]
MPNGILLLNKPEGTRSTDCVTRVKRYFNEKAGHAGTLDSTACGLLVMLLGNATRLSDYIMLLPKVYSAVVRLGAETDTADSSGEIVSGGNADNINEADVDSILHNFKGEIMQTPPLISAIKVGGRAAHRITRSIKKDANAEREFSLPARSVYVHSIIRTSPVLGGEFEIKVHCGKGTYIRSIARDIGRMLGCGGHVKKLKRLSVGDFSLHNACDLEELSHENLLPIESIGTFYNRIFLKVEAEERLLNGLSIALNEAGEYVPGEIDAKHVAVIGKTLFGFAEVRDNGEVSYLHPRVNIRRSEVNK